MFKKLEFLRIYLDFNEIYRFIGNKTAKRKIEVLIEIIEGKQAKENHNFCCLGKQKETKYHQLFTFIVSYVWT